jgi:Ser/Thr protein kinase RdoA (MazF antagonist)
MIVELAGPVGAGKSAVAEGLPDALRARGVSVSRLHEIGRFNRPRTWLWNARFAVTHPRLAWTAARAVLGAPIPWWHRRLILGLVLGVGGRIDFARRLVPRPHVVLVDEGLVHRSVNLFGWNPATPPDAVRRYIGLVPLPDAILYIEADPVVEHERALSRGVPKRLVGRSPEEVEAFVGRAREVAGAAIDAVEARGGAAVVRLKNRQSVRRTITNAANATSRLAIDRVARGDGTVFRPHAPLIPRPDRLLARRAAAPSGAIPRAQLAEVLERYGLAVNGRPRTLSAPGARGATVRVNTSGGEVAVKRYKDGVDPSVPAIEHAVLQALASQGFPSPRLRHAPRGETAVSVDGACFAVYDAIGRGYSHPHELAMAPGDRRMLEAIAGRLLAELHRTMEAVEVPASESLGFVARGGPRVRDVEWYTTRLARAPAPRRVRAWAESALWRLWETMDRSQLPLTVVHGDYGPYNLLVRPGSVPVLVDFELARLDWRMVDLATGLPWFAGRRRGFDVPAARRLLDAYREASGAPGDELERIPDVLAFLALQRAVVAWTRAEGDAAPRWSAEARQRIVLAEDLLAGTHPLHAVVHRW